VGLGWVVTEGAVHVAHDGGGVVAGLISIARVPHGALALSEPLTDKADGPPK
jgi:hypothetical protein